MAKKTGGSKSSANKSTAKKAVKKVSAREKLEKELGGMIKEVDNDGLLFLIRQANVLLHNKRVDELNAEMAKLNKGKKDNRKKAGTTARVGQNVKEITVELQQSPDKKTYYMIIDGQKHFFTDAEMAKVVRLCIKPDTKTDAKRFLFQYLDKERKEVLMDHGIAVRNHPFFEALFYEVRSKFSLSD
jgi:hypothetical protein